VRRVWQEKEGIAMDHDEVVRHQMTEKYLLNELESARRDEFEEHYFSCTTCAADVHAGALFIDQAKTVLAETVAVERPEPPPVRHQSAWFAWLRPMFALPALAVLLAVVGYQNLVTIPRLASSLETPHVLPFASINVATYGSEAPSIRTKSGEGVLVFVRIPPDETFVHYAAELYNPAQQLEWSISFQPSQGEDEYPLQIPGKELKNGSYSLHVMGMTASGENKEVGKAMFEVQIQN
jgi:hypothetical protein